MVSRYARLFGIVGVIAFLLWGAGLGYWRFVVSNCISAVESAAKPAGAAGIQEYVLKEVLDDFKGCGDRALPRIVEALDTQRSPSFLAAMSRQFIERVVRVVPIADPDALRIAPADSAQDIERKCDELRTMWSRLEGRYRWWMWWTAEGLE